MQERPFDSDNSINSNTAIQTQRYSTLSSFKSPFDTIPPLTSLNGSKADYPLVDVRKVNRRAYRLKKKEKRAGSKATEAEAWKRR